MKIVDRICDEYGDDMLIMTGYDHCIIGVLTSFQQSEPVVAYDYDLVIEQNMARGMSRAEAIEFFEFNQMGAWVGDRTPAFIERMDNRGD